MGMLRFDSHNNNNGRTYEQEVPCKSLYLAKNLIKRMNTFNTPGVTISNFRYQVLGKKEKKIVKV